MPIKILVADDDKDYVDLFTPSVEGKGRAIYAAYTPDEVITAVNTNLPDIVFLDYDFDGRGVGIKLLKKIKKTLPQSVVVMVTAKGTKEVEMETMRWGGFNYLNKDDDPESNEKKINRIINLFKYGTKNKKDKIENNMVGLEGIEEIHTMISRFAMYDEAVILITGESGTGKQLVAKNIHLEGPGRAEPFLTLNCCAVPDTLIETQLFGYKKGTFTGAVQDNKGLFESAGKGTVFLDEIGSASLNFQLNLLHVLETREYFSVGDYTPKQCRARIVLATNEDLETAVEKGRFRQDLYYRINSLHIKLPSLRELRSDIPLLIGYLLYVLCKKHGEHRSVASEIIKVCENVAWNGNVRELRGALERCLILTDDSETLTSNNFYKYCAAALRKKSSNKGTTLKEQVEYFEKRLIQDALYKTRTQKEAAHLLGVIEATLSEKIKKYGLRKGILMNGAGKGYAGKGLL